MIAALAKHKIGLLFYSKVNKQKKRNTDAEHRLFSINQVLIF